MTLAHSLRKAFFVKEKNEKDIAFSENDKLHKKEDSLFSKDAWAIFAQKIPSKNCRLKNIIQEELFNLKEPDLFWQDVIKKMEVAEEEFYTKSEDSLFSWDENYFKSAFEKEGFSVEVKSSMLTEKRRIEKSDIERWFSHTSSYGQKILTALGQEAFEKVKAFLIEECPKKIFNWKSTYLFAKVFLPQEATINF